MSRKPRRERAIADFWSDPRECLCSCPVYTDSSGVVREQESKAPHVCPLADVDAYVARPYVARFLDALTAAAIPSLPGTVAILDVAHDDDCALLRGTGPCRCDPDLSLRFLAIGDG